MTSFISNIVFNDASASGSSIENDKSMKGGYVHIRIQQRAGKKSITTVQGLADDLDLKKILKALKKTYNTNGTVIADDENGMIIQLAGDQRKNVSQFLTMTHICEESQIKIHGF